MCNNARFFQNCAVFLFLVGVSACGGGGANDSGDGTTNSPPTISGTPALQAKTSENYSFTPQANDLDGDRLTFSINSLPSWGTFNNGNGSLTGIPTEQDIGEYPSIIISVSDGKSSSSLSTFSVEVIESKSVAEVLDEMPAWSEFSPKAYPEENEGQEIVDQSIEPDEELLLDENNILKICTTERVDFFQTPEEFVMFSPPENILFPGALVQGKSLRDGNNTGEILPLDITQREMVRVSIPACQITNNFREVLPAQALVASAIASILAEAEAIGTNCIQSRLDFKNEIYRNENQRALKAKMSGKYFGFSANADTSYSKTDTQNSIATVFRESMFTVQIQAPATPRGWFNDEFTSEILQEQIDLGNMGNDNVPGYVSTVTYGRIFTSTLTSKYSEKDLKFAMDFKYANPASSVSGDAAERSKKIRSESNLTIASIGGPPEASAAAIRTEDWTQYFGVTAKASDAVPISFQIRSTSDNTPAVSQELTSYDRVQCFDKVADDATFSFKPEQVFTPQFTGNGQLVAIGDINGDGADDIVWANNNSAGRGEFAVALGNGDGTFQPLIESESTAMSGLSGSLTLNLIDIDNDGRDDLIFNLLKNTATSSNRVFVSFYKGEIDPVFIHNDGQVLGSGTGWEEFKLYTYQMDNSLGEDLVWNNTPNSSDNNRTYIAHAVEMSSADFNLETDDLFVMRPSFNVAGNYSGYEYVHLGDFDGDNYGDILWQNIDSNNNVMYIAYGNQTGIDIPFTLRNLGGDWGIYSAFVGDNDNDGRSDIIEPRQYTAFNNFGVYVAHGTPERPDVIDPHTFKLYNDTVRDASIEAIMGGNVALQPDMFVADVDGNGGTDLIINEKGIVDGLTNNIAVGLAVVSDTGFNFLRAPQEHPAKIDWSQYILLTGDFNCDKRDDIVWVSSAASNSIYTGVSRGEEVSCPN